MYVVGYVFGLCRCERNEVEICICVFMLSVCVCKWVLFKYLSVWVLCMWWVLSNGGSYFEKNEVDVWVTN